MNEHDRGRLPGSRGLVRLPKDVRDDHAVARLESNDFRVHEISRVDFRIQRLRQFGQLAAGFNLQNVEIVRGSIGVDVKRQLRFAARDDERLEDLPAESTEAESHGRLPFRSR